MTIPDGVTTIPSSTELFRGSAVASVGLNDVTGVEAYAFQGSSLSYVSGETVTQIGDQAFANTKLATYTVPSTLTVLAQNAFRGTKISSFNGGGGNYRIYGGSIYSDEGKTLYIVPEGKTDSVIVSDVATKIASGALSGATRVTDIYIPSTVTTIEEGATTGSSVIAPNGTIFGYTGSAAETYANGHDIRFSALNNSNGGNDTPTTPTTPTDSGSTDTGGTTNTPDASNNIGSAGNTNTSTNNNNSQSAATPVSDNSTTANNPSTSQNNNSVSAKPTAGNASNSGDNKPKNTTPKPSVTPPANTASVQQTEPSLPITSSRTLSSAQTASSYDDEDDDDDDDEIEDESEPVLRKVRWWGTDKSTFYWRENEKMDGYKLQYSTHPKFKKEKTKAVLSKVKKVTIKDIEKNRKYYVRVRAYEDIDGEKYWSPWSHRIIVKRVQ